MIGQGMCIFFLDFEKNLLDSSYHKNISVKKTYCTLRYLLNELARLIPKLGVKQASSFNRDLRVSK